MPSLQAFGADAETQVCVGWPLALKRVQQTWLPALHVVAPQGLGTFEPPPPPMPETPPPPPPVPVAVPPPTPSVAPKPSSRLVRPQPYPQPKTEAAASSKPTRILDPETVIDESRS